MLASVMRRILRLGLISNIISTTTYDASTRQTNQRLGIVLSNGFVVVVFKSTSTNAKFYYSSNYGETWSNYGVDIAGWANGSINSYVDAGGIERVVAIWRQTGAGGGRTDGRIYVMVGTFNSGRTSLSWGTPVDIGNTLDDTPDLVVIPEGTGGVVHYVCSMTNSTPESWARYGAFNIDSSGGLTVKTAIMNLSGNYGTWLGNTSPSIDFDPLTKRLFVGWQTSTLGDGYGVRFRTAAYAAGSWVWAPEVQVDILHSLIVAFPQPGGIRCRWDGSRVIIAGLLSDGASYDLMLYESTNFISFTIRELLSNTVNLKNGAAMVVYGAGDVYFFGNNGSNEWHMYKWVRGTLTLGPKIVFESATLDADAAVTPWFGLSRFMYMYVSGTASPYNIRFRGEDI